LVINKIDLASHVGADLSVMEHDAKKIRKEKPFVFINCKADVGIKQVVEYIIRDVLFEQPPKTLLHH
jgi:urease accessory protein